MLGLAADRRRAVPVTDLDGLTKGRKTGGEHAGGSERPERKEMAAGKRTRRRRQRFAYRKDWLGDGSHYASLGPGLNQVTVLSHHYTLAQMRLRQPRIPPDPYQSPVSVAFVQHRFSPPAVLRVMLRP